jgi:outer membrane protein OmpA-like peptidoglycan-associated protein
MPPDRDGDGIPDQYDKCPDQPEDKDGIDDGDGCPEDDYDKDGVPDATDACPKEPGQPAPDPKRNGCPQFIKMENGRVDILQQVHFQSGSSNILPDSFPMLQEIANLLKANQNIKRMAIEGHTDDRGDDQMNQRLSQGRAESVMRWLTQHGVDAQRLEAHGYGESKPIADNKTDKGRAANRRVEFKILDEEDTNKVKK